MPAEINVTVCAKEPPLVLDVLKYRNVVVVRLIPVFVPLVLIDVFALSLPMVVKEGMTDGPVREDKVVNVSNDEELVNT